MKPLHVIMIISAHLSIIITASSSNSNPLIPTSIFPSFSLRRNMVQEKKWFPLESNPALLNRYISNLGFSTSSYSFTDVYSTEDWALQMITQPVLALVVLFPMSEKISDCRREIHQMVRPNNSSGLCNSVWYIKQRIRNACGTIGKFFNERFTISQQVLSLIYTIL